MSTGVRTTAAVAALAVTSGAIALNPRLPAGTDPAVGVALIGVAWAAFAVGALLVLRLPVRVATPLILAGGLLVLLSAGFGPPRSSDDLYRYLWDGRVQAAGIDPYEYAPAAAQLVGLRDEFLWPAQGHSCAGEGSRDTATGAALAPGCTRINRPTVHTIYPPVAEAMFLAIHVLSPRDAQYQPVQVAAAGLAVATTVVLLVGLARLRRDPRRAVLWAWCPTVAIETASNGHIDVAAAFLTALALITLAAARHRGSTAAGGALLGLAIATKLTPILVLPAVLRRRPVTVLAAAATAVGAVYLPHLLAVGRAVLGYLPGYLTEEGYADGSRFALIDWALPGRWAQLVAVLIVLGGALVVARAADPDQPWRPAAVLASVALLVTTPAYPWYAILLVLLVSLGGRAELLVVAAAGYLAAYPHELHLAPTTARRIAYGLALLAVVAVAAVRSRTRDRGGRAYAARGCAGLRGHRPARSTTG
jgi:hypothetical protein